MPKNKNVAGDDERKVVKVDVRSVIIVAILAFGGGAVAANPQPSNADTPPTQPRPARENSVRCE
jgi:hypothetical protein